MNIKSLVVLFLSVIMFACSEQTNVSDDNAGSLYQEQIKALEKAKETEKLLLDAAQKRAHDIQKQGG